MDIKQPTSIVWLRRDLRLEDNNALYHAINYGKPVQVVFIFDKKILTPLERDDARVTFIHQQLTKIDQQLKERNGGLLTFFDEPENAWNDIVKNKNVKKVFFNSDYEPYALERDKNITELLLSKKIEVHTFKDQVIFEKNEIVKDDNKPYTVYTPFKNKWLRTFSPDLLKPISITRKASFIKPKNKIHSLKELGFIMSEINVIDFRISDLQNYSEERNFPAKDSTSYLSPHLRFGTISIRKLLSKVWGNDVFVSELIWREFFMQIMWHFPNSSERNFKPQYNLIQWRNNEADFKKWCAGKTGYPMVDAGMRELNKTGYMHNRVRMVVASFLVKHLLIEWKWGEAYFAEKLLDFELASNAGNWQWAAGTGCDAAPYFRVFNPTTQIEKFDKEYKYIKKWVPEFGTHLYPKPMVEHKFARERVLTAYKKGLGKD